MAKRQIHPEWRRENEATKYPFSSLATMASDTNVILEGLFLDAAIYTIGGQERAFLSKVTITHDLVTITVGDVEDTARAFGSFPLLNPPTRFKLEDVYGRPAGVIVSEALRLASFQSWSVGEHDFAIEHTEFAATVVTPTPEIGVRGILLADGSLFTDDVYMVGDDGIVLTEEIVQVPGTCDEPSKEVTTIRVDVVGDPLFRRRLCDPNALFATPRFLETVTFDDGKQQIKCGPDALGDIKMTAGSHLIDDTVLRIRAAENGLVVESVGDPLDGVR
jgi:hypothetical protein